MIRSWIRALMQRFRRGRHPSDAGDALTNQSHYTGGNYIKIDTDQERDPPPPATPVTFPAYNPSNGIHWNGPDSAPSFQALFSQVLRPTDIKHQHLNALNIELLPPCPAEELLPLSPAGTSYIPSPSLSPVSNAASYAEAAKSDPQLGRRRAEYEERLAELSIDNDLAFRTISRSLPRGTRGPRLASMRKFWDGLEGMCQYWDCSLDQYFEVPAMTSDSEKSGKRPRWEEDANEVQVSGKPGNSGDETAESSANAQWPEDSSSSPPVTPSRPIARYKGQRTSTGRQMPEQFRTDTVKALVDSTIWPFQCVLAPPTRLPIVQFNNLNLPVRQTAAIYRLPRDRTKGRQEVFDGPMMGLQVRAETDFVAVDGRPQEVQSRLDVMRELGGLLQIAQERRREGKEAIKPGEGKWWTTRPRWGGGSNGVLTDRGGDSIDIVEATVRLIGAQDSLGGRKDRDTKAGKRKMPATSWEQVSCGSGHWDPRTNYKAIGKDPASAYDEVFMISSLNHHICILKLTVHEAYMKYVTFGTLPSSQPAEVDWCRPKLQRSPWFDLFDLKQRVECFRALWGVITYLDRDTHAEDAEIKLL